jgi:nucleoid DNA-binding protein
MPDGTATAVRPLSKSQLVQELADGSGQSKASVRSVLDTLETVIQKQLGKRGAGVFVLPGLVKIQRHKRPARKARQGINPFTKEPTTFKAQPARTVAKVRPLKKLKEFVS